MAGDEQTVDRINPVRRWQEQVILEALTSEWVATLADHPVRLSLADNGRYVMDHHEGHWTAEDQHLTLVTHAGYTLVFDYKLEGNQLTLSGGDLIRPLTLQSKPPMRHLFKRLFHFSPQDTLDSLYRILIILGLAVAVRMVLAMVGRFNRMLIFSNRGPMRLAIWPGQQWVIEQQLTARLREVFARESIAIASDRVVVYYYPREYLSNSAVPRRWRRRQKNQGS